ncbi:MAG: guanylate kinase [Candidatus Omnitrophica bacterium]|nr:guanylate kinase [Candidatus Omnitrophota bacterium]
MWNKKQGFLFIVSGPSGSGKTTLASGLLKAPELKNSLVRSVSLTTRPRRRGERDKKDYFFVSENEFKRLLKAKKILEWTRYLGYYYATPKDFVEGYLKKNKHLILCLDIKGARALKRFYPENAVTIFVMPSSLSVLKSRIEKRSRETAKEEIRGRLRLAENELLAADTYDYCLVNEDLKQGVEELKGIILAKIKSKGQD